MSVAPFNYLPLEILGGQNFGKNIQYLPDTNQVLQKVASKTDSIYLASTPQGVPQCSIKSVPEGRSAGLVRAALQKAQRSSQSHVCVSAIASLLTLFREVSSQ